MVQHEYALNLYLKITENWVKEEKSFPWDIMYRYEGDWSFLNDKTKAFHRLRNSRTILKEWGYCIEKYPFKLKMGKEAFWTRVNSPAFEEWLFIEASGVGSTLKSLAKLKNKVIRIQVKDKKFFDFSEKEQIEQLKSIMEEYLLQNLNLYYSPFPPKKKRGRPKKKKT